jgi:hypothetical protein
MDPYRQLRDSLSSLIPSRATILQGIVKAVNGITCTVTIGSIDVPGVRLRASELDDSSHILITPKVGSPVILGSLSGDLSNLVVLQVDHVASITVNGGSLGGLINIAQLTAKLNRLVDAFNAHTHSVTVAHPGGTFTTLAPGSSTPSFNKKDYEDTTVTH